MHLARRTEPKNACESKASDQRMHLTERAQAAGERSRTVLGTSAEEQSIASQQRAIKHFQYGVCGFLTT